MLYYSLGYSYIEYQIMVGGAATKSLLLKIGIRQNNIFGKI